jgi:Immunoglobulin I-set domain
MTTDTELNVHRLRLKDVKLTAAGRYTVRAVNSSGQIEASAELAVKGIFLRALLLYY